jgi:hypothetical protein
MLECDISGGHLAYIETQAENDCLVQYITEGAKYIDIEEV